MMHLMTIRNESEAVKIVTVKLRGKDDPAIVINAAQEVSAAKKNSHLATREQEEKAMRSNKVKLFRLVQADDCTDCGIVIKILSFGRI